MTPKKENLDREFYFGDKAEFYARSKWMARNQRKSTQKAVQLLEDSRIGGELPFKPKYLVILDLGCGTGFSTEVLERNSFHTIGLDNSFDMLVQNLDQTLPYHRNLICGLIEALPFRENSIDIIVSISAFNFILKDMAEHEKTKRIRKVSRTLATILGDLGKCVIEFYPKKQDIAYYLESFKEFEGGMVIDNPNQRKEQKFLILQVRPDKKVS